MSDTFTPRHRLALTLFVALLVWSALWHTWLAPATRLGVVQNLLLALSPALIPGLMSFISARGMLLGAGFAALLLFCHAVMSAWATPNWLAWPAIVLSVGTVLALGGRQKPRPAPGNQ